MSELGRFNYFKIFLEKGPFILLVVSVLNEFDFNYLNLKYFSFNFPFILIYYCILKRSCSIGYGFIFLSGIISDVVFGLPLGVNSLALLIIAAVATYVRVVTVRITLINDWISFIPALLIANFVYFLALYFSNYTIDYIFLFKNSISTFIFYPLLWGIFSLTLNLMKS